MVRPLDGHKRWQEEYYVLPFRQTVRELPRDKKTHGVWVDLRGSFAQRELPEGAEEPSRLEVLVVNLPFTLRGWFIDKVKLNLEEPDLSAAILDRSEFILGH